MFHFSYVQEAYDEVKESKRYYLSWKNKEKEWSYADCKVQVIGMNDDKARIIVRRKKSGYSSFMKSNFEVNLMMGFVASNVRRVTTDGKDTISFDVEQSKDKRYRELKDVKIWSDNEHETEDKYNEILQKRGSDSGSKIIESDHLERSNSVVPVIYQPKVDAWENFLREIHVHQKDDSSFEMTLIFQDETLRKHGILNGIYRYIRLLKYKRTMDIETFSFKDNQFYFGDIYSGDSNLFEDTIHNEMDIPAKYYFQDTNHPVIFVNTSNHALAPHDNNHDLWKWEYVPWSGTIPIKSGTKSRDEIERSFE
ncbi:hypothetical protein K0U27_10665 [archaeon]|nr:hypothetical protein [archaeon]